MRRAQAVALLVAALAACNAAAGIAAEALNFGRVPRSSTVERTIAIANPGATPLQLHKLALSPGLRVVRMPRTIEPGGNAELTLRFDPSGMRGRYAGAIGIYTSEQEPRVIEVQADVLAAIEFVPRPVFFVAGVRGEARAASIEIVNHDPEPLHIETPSSAHEHFTTDLQTVDPGRHYRLTLSLRSDAAAGRHRETIELATSSPDMPRIRIEANTLLRERVHAHPDVVDLGSIPISTIRRLPDVLQQLAQTVMVYQAGGRDFRISSVTDVPGLAIRAAAGPQGDRHQLTLTLDGSQAKVGPIRGTLTIRTNDEQWRSIEIPISGAIVDD